MTVYVVASYTLASYALENNHFIISASATLSLMLRFDDAAGLMIT